jgi:hypothetical protein
MKAGIVCAIESRVSHGLSIGREWKQSGHVWFVPAWDFFSWRGRRTAAFGVLTYRPRSDIDASFTSYTSHREFFMTHFFSFKTMFVISLLTPFVGHTQENIVRCNSEAGAAKFTDASCVHKAGTGRSAAMTTPSTVKNKTVTQSSKFFAAEEARIVAFANRPMATYRLPVDVATLKSAISLTTSLDEMPVSERRLTLASFAVYP